MKSMKIFKKLFAIILTAALLLTAVPMGTFSVVAAENTTEFAGGDGTAEKPYLISTKEHLNNIRFHNSSYFKMINDIIFSEEDYSEDGLLGLEGWSPISFSGVFDGCYHKISNLKINRENTDNIGLFSNASGNISNINLIDAIIFGNENVGGICGYLHSTYTKSANISHCFVSGKISAKTNNVGGICGKVEGWAENRNRYSAVYLTENFNFADVNGSQNVGGIVGNSVDRHVRIQKCVNAGNVSGESVTGGICGIIDKSGYIVEVSQGYNVYQQYGSIENCYNMGVIESEISGGIVGSNVAITSAYFAGGGIYRSYNIGTVCGTNSGGIIGSSFKGDISSCLYLNKSVTNPTTTYGESITSAGLIAKSSNAFTSWDFNSIWTMAGDSEYLYPKLRCFGLYGDVDIDGAIVYDEQISADVSNVENYNNPLTYQWMIDGEAIPDSDFSTYTIKDTDIGKKISVKVICKFPMNKGDLTSQEFTVSKAVQPASPAVPELVTKDDKSFEISTVSTQEYSIDNQNWQTGGKFENLDPNKEYTVYARIIENDLYLTSNSKAVFTVTTDRRPLSGSANITGTPRYGDTLSADVSAVLPANATYSYEWKSGETVVGTGSTYKIIKDDIGKSITVSVKGTNNFIGTLTSAAVTATKTTVQTPAAPTVSEKTNVSVNLTAKTGFEYSMDQVKWQDSTLFEGLSAVTEYTFYQRIKATDTTFASAASTGLKVTTLKNTIAAPAKPVVEEVTNETVTLKKINGYEYSKDGLAWQTSNVFTGLNPYKEYTFCQRVAETQTDYASAQSEFTTVITLKNSIVAPNAPTVKSATESSVILNAISGYEYSKDGTTWQKSNVFNGLVLFDTYAFYQRVAETNVDYASPASKALSFKIKNVVSKADKPELLKNTNTYISVKSVAGYEYSLGGTNWSTATVFTDLKPNTQYFVYCRLLEDDTHYASEMSDALVVTTLKNTVSKPSAPTTTNVTSSSVTLTANAKYEYSKDGTTWQISNVFNGLSPNKEYTFYQRVAETDSDYASEKSDGKKVTTLKNTVNAPSTPTLSSKTDASITLTQKAGYEYSKDGTTWQKSNVFTGLSANTEYSFYQRIAETDTTYASSKSDALKVTTYKHTLSTTPTAPTVKKAYATSVILYYIEGYEYSKNGTTWQKNNVFTGLTANTEYTFYQRIAETADTCASTKSPAVKVKTTEKPACSITPIKPIVTNYTSSSVTLYALNGYEYSKNGTTWQSSTTFSGLSANTTYTFYQRIKETAEEKASDKSVGVSVKTAKNVQASDWSTVPGSLSYNYKTVEDYIKKSSNTDTAGNKYVYWQNNDKTISLKITLYPDGLQFSSTASAYDNYDHLTEVLYFRISDKSNSFVTHFYVDYMISFNTGMITDDDKTLTKSEITKSSYYQRYKTGTGVSSTTFTEMYNDTLQNTLNTFDIYLYGLFGFGFKGLGFTKYAGYGTTADNSCKHLGSTEIRGKRDATCTIPGYTGDVYCTTCGEKISSGTTIPCTGHHTYDNACDTTCNVCGETRRVEHTYSCDCDCECDICGHGRVAPKEHDFGDGDTCKNCGSAKYTPGDLDGVEGVTDSDAVYLLMYTFFPEDYPVDQPLDFDGDGNVTDADAIYLLMYTFFPEDYPI